MSGEFLPATVAFQIAFRPILHDPLNDALHKAAPAAFPVFVKELFTFLTVDGNRSNVFPGHFIRIPQGRYLNIM